MNPTSAAIDLTREDPRGDAARKLMRDLSAEETLRYRDLGSGPDPFDSFRVEDVLGPRTAFVVARLAGQAVGCGALRQIDAGAAEINRMYVAPAVRRRGIGRAIVRELERQAVAFGYGVIRLETGDRQPEAIGLYVHLGFRRAAAFGAHRDDPVSVFFEKIVGGEDGQTGQTATSR